MLRTTGKKAGILTLVFLALGVMVMAGGVGDWKALSGINDPLPQAMKAVVLERKIEEIIAERERWRAQAQADHASLVAECKQKCSAYELQISRMRRQIEAFQSRVPTPSNPGGEEKPKPKTRDALWNPTSEDKINIDFRR